MTEYRILFLGDVMGEPGRRAVQHALPSLKDTHKPLFTIINGENAAAGTDCHALDAVAQDRG